MTKILIISQGGKVCSSMQTGSYMPKPEEFEVFMRFSIKANGTNYDFISIKEDVHGENSCHPEDCNQLGEIIEKNYDDYDGFFILRGAMFSDYVGASLTFSLEGNHKPILIGDAQMSFDNSMTDAQQFLSTGLYYLATVGQEPDRRTDISILSDNVIMKAIDATLFTDGTMRYYSRTGNNYYTENLCFANERDDPRTALNNLRRIPINTDYTIPMHQGVGSFGDEFNILTDIGIDALIVTTNKRGGFSTPDAPYPHHMSLVRKFIRERNLPVIMVNQLSHSNVETGFDDMEGFVVASTMSPMVALAKTRHVLSITDSNLAKFKATMLDDKYGELPDIRDLMRAIRPEIQSGASRARLG